MSVQTPTDFGSGMQLIEAASQETIDAVGCTSWPTWGCETSTFPWTYDQTEVCLFIKGDVVVTCDETGDKMRVKEGDIALFPAGMSCTWKVTKDVHKYYSFGTDLSALKRP